MTRYDACLINVVHAFHNLFVYALQFLQDDLAVSLLLHEEFISLTHTLAVQPHQQHLTHPTTAGPNVLVGDLVVSNDDLHLKGTHMTSGSEGEQCLHQHVMQVSISMSCKSPSACHVSLHQHVMQVSISMSCKSPSACHASLHQHVM